MRPPTLAFQLLTLTSVLPAHAISFEVGYSYDTNGFFGSAGSSQRTTFEAALGVYASLIDQSLNAITPSGFNTWTARFWDPSSGNLASETNLVIAQNTLLIYAGGYDMGGALGMGGPGGFSASGTTAFLDSVVRGNSPDTHATWGGSVMFDTSTNWYFSSDGEIVPDDTYYDFFTVALHEVGHLLGLSVETGAWTAHQTGSTFGGEHALAAYRDHYGSSATGVPLESAGDRHWQGGTLSHIHGTDTLQEALMTSGLRNGENKHLTDLDTAALQDIGWQIIPEPSALPLAVFSGLFLMRRKRGNA